ncbi:MAG: universal stress protein [Myxococcaceae bacterium]|nr:universal stress protein [Myxococcaceae bacterium]
MMNDTVTRNRAAVPRRLLLALRGADLPTQSLERALAISRLLDAELYVLRVESTRTSSFPLFPQLNSLAALQVVAHGIEVLEATRRWLAAVGGASQVTALETREGDFVVEVAARALELGIELIVVPPQEGHFGASVTELARTARAPVLVARPPGAGEGDALSHELSWALAMETAEALSAGRLEQLAASSGRAKAGEGVRLELSRRRAADLVVVGTREPSPLASLFRGELAADIVERSGRSVLVLPLAEALHAAA